MESEFVQAGLDKIERLQQEIFEEVMDYPNLDYDEKLEHLGKLEELIETQSLMYARMSLSDDPAAIERRKNSTNHRGRQTTRAFYLKGAGKSWL